MTSRGRKALEWLLLTLIAVRPSLDITTDWRIGGAGINLAALTGLLLIAAGTLWLAFLPKEQRTRLLTETPFVVWILFVALMLPWAIVPMLLYGAERLAGLREWIRIVSIVPVFVFAVHLAQSREHKRLVGALLLSAMIPAVVGCWQLFFGQGQQVLGIHRIQGTFVHPNPFAFYLVTILVVLYACGRQSAGAWHWWVMGGGVLLLLAGTLSFTGAGMFGVAALVLLAGESKAVRIGVLLMLIVFGALFMATDAGRERVRDLTQWDDLDEIEATGRETPSHVWRLLNWRFLYREWIKQPVFGYGLARIPDVNPNQNVYKNYVGHDAHNDYVRFLVETGVVGFLIWLAFLGAMTWAFFRRYRMADTQARIALLAALALLAAWLAGSLNDNLIQATAYQYVLWGALGVAYGMSCQSPEKPTPCG